MAESEEADGIDQPRNAGQYEKIDRQTVSAAGIVLTDSASCSRAGLDGTLLENHSKYS